MTTELTDRDATDLTSRSFRTRGFGGSPVRALMRFLLRLGDDHRYLSPGIIREFFLRCGSFFLWANGGDCIKNYFGEGLLRYSAMLA